MVTARATAAWFAGQHWSDNTMRSHVSAVRSFYRWAVAHDLTTSDPTRTLPRMHPEVLLPRPATERAIEEALHRADSRQHLMLMLGSRHGLRRGEIARIHTTDLIEEDDGEWALLVHGKGGKKREMPLRPETALALRECPAGWVFPNGKGSHLTPGHVGVLISRALPAGVTPHQLRHRYATVVYRRTLDILQLQGLLGHTSVATTQRYAGPDPDRRRAVSAAAA